MKTFIFISVLLFVAGLYWAAGQWVEGLKAALVP